MNLQNVKQKLDKVSRFYAYLEENQEIVSRVDRDSLIASIRELYDACFEGEDAPVQQVVSTKKEVAPTTKKEPVADTTKKKRPKLVFNDTSSDTTEQENTVKKEPVTIKEETVIKTEPKQEPVVQKEEAVEEGGKEEEKAPKGGFNGEYEELFMFEAVADLSQKLSAAPLKDLNKALGLNEKFLYINELFGGDVAKFQASIKILNEGSSFAAARSHMESDLIEQHEWMDKTKKSLAKDFVKLVRRRYL